MNLKTFQDVWNPRLISNGEVSGRLPQHTAQTPATENSVLHKSCGSKITHRITEKVAWKQTELNEHRNSRITDEVI